MENIWFLLYNVIAVPVQYFFYQAARYFNAKVSVGIRGRKGQLARIRQALCKIDTSMKRILFHCVSVGEWEQALPVITRLKHITPDIFIIVAFFSPSGYRYVKDHPLVDLKVYLPFDSYFGARKFLRVINPDIWLVVKHDIWPNHMFAAKNLNIPVVLIDATLPANSKRIAPVMRHFNRHVYDAFHYMFPISDGDKERLLQVYPFPEKLIVSGDTRFDQVYNRGKNALRDSQIHLFDHNNGAVFIAGSIWPSDEKHLLPAVKQLLKQYAKLNIILVPHEPAERHIIDIETKLQTASIHSKRYSDIKKSGINGTRVAIIDAIGILAKLYSQSDIAYVGGSFGPGVHNVMEPGVLGKPVIFGPRHVNSFEASELIRCGGGFSVNSSHEIADLVGAFLDDTKKRLEAGGRAMGLIQQNIGATEKIYNKLKDIYDFIPQKDSD